MNLIVQASPTHLPDKSASGDSDSDPSADTQPAEQKRCEELAAKVVEVAGHVYRLLRQLDDVEAEKMVDKEVILGLGVRIMELAMDLKDMDQAVAHGLAWGWISNDYARKVSMQLSGFNSDVDLFNSYMRTVTNADKVDYILHHEVRDRNLEELRAMGRDHSALGVWRRPVGMLFMFSN